MELDVIKNKLLVKYPFFGNIIVNINIIEDNDCIDFNGNPTLGTDGENICIHPEIFTSLSLEEKMFLLAHEISHVAFDHIYRREGKDRKIWNIATDAVINVQLKQDGLSLVKGAVYIPEAINYSADELYEILIKEKDNNIYKNYSFESNNNEICYNNHQMWDNQKNNKNIISLDEKNIYKLNRNGQKKLLNQMKEQLLQESLGIGEETNSYEIKLEHIGYSNSCIDWRLYLKEAIKYDVDWSYQNVSIEDGIITAHLEDIPQPETEILLDTSGSINNNLLKNFLRECKSILQNSKVKVGCFDTKFYGFQEIKYEKDIDKMIFIGRGGTDFLVAVKSFSNRVENKIIFTDGKGKTPSKPADVIWVVYGDNKINPIGGKVIYLDDKDKEKLNVKMKIL